MRASAKDKPTNQWIISAQLNQATYEKLDELCRKTGMSRSRMIKVLIAGAKINVSASMRKEPDNEE